MRMPQPARYQAFPKASKPGMRIKAGWISASTPPGMGSLDLHAAELHVRIDRDHEATEIWLDVARGDVRSLTRFNESLKTVH